MPAEQILIKSQNLLCPYLHPKSFGLFFDYKIHLK